MRGPRPPEALVAADIRGGGRKGGRVCVQGMYALAKAVDGACAPPGARRDLPSHRVRENGCTRSRIRKMKEKRWKPHGTASGGRALFRYQRQDGADGWSDYIDDAISFVNRKPMPYGSGTLENAPNEIEASFEQDNVANPSKVPAFEMQRQAARDYKVNKKVQSAAKARLAATNTFRQRLPPECGPSRQRLPFAGSAVFRQGGRPAH